MTLAERLSQLNWGGTEYPSYDGLMKGDHSSHEQAAADDQRTLENQIMQQQLNLQRGQLLDVNKVVDPMIAQGGMGKGQEAALTSLFMNNLGNQGRAAVGDINQQLAARGISGGSNAGSGDIARNFGGMYAQLAGAQQQGLAGIQAQKYQQLMQELGLKLGIGSQFGNNVGSFNQGAIGAGNTAMNAANNADQAQTSWMGPVFGALGGGLSGWATGGFKHG